MLKVSKQITGNEPITLEQAKAFLRVDGNGDDVLITSLISQVRELAETYLNMSIIETTVSLLASPRQELILPFGPVQTVTSVKDVDDEDVSYHWNGFYIKFDQGTVSVTGGNAMYVETITTYTTGLPTISAGLELGLLEAMSWLYENRGDSSGFQMMLYRNQNLQVYRQTVWI